MDFFSFALGAIFGISWTLLILLKQARLRRTRLEQGIVEVRNKRYHETVDVYFGEGAD